MFVEYSCIHLATFGVYPYMNERKNRERRKAFTSDSNKPTHDIIVGLLKIKNLKISKGYSQLTQTPKMELFERIVNS